LLLLKEKTGIWSPDFRSVQERTSSDLLNTERAHACINLTIKSLTRTHRAPGMPACAQSALDAGEDVLRVHGDASHLQW
jgi:hypothetical protein